jgi:hypothetical protein
MACYREALPYLTFTIIIEINFLEKEDEMGRACSTNGGDLSTRKTKT